MKALAEIIRIGPVADMVWTSRLYSTKSLKHEGHLRLDDYERIKRLPTKYSRHDVGLYRHKSSGELTLIKNTKLHDDFITGMAWGSAQESGVNFDSAFSEIKSHVDYSPQNLRFLAEREAFITSLMKLFAPGHVTDRAFVVSNFDKKNPEYFVAWKFIEDYIGFDKLPQQDGKRFIVEKGVTRLILSLTPLIHVAVSGRIATKLALNAIRETDSNSENIGIAVPRDVLEGRIMGGDTKYPIISIDHEMALDDKKQCGADIEAKDVFTLSQKIASGKSFSVFDCMDLNHLEIARRREVREESILRIRNIFADQEKIQELVFQKFSLGYDEPYRDKIKEITGQLKTRGTYFAAANTLLKGNWDGSQENADAILQKRYGEDYNSLTSHQFWVKELGQGFQKCTAGAVEVGASRQSRII